MSKQQMSEIVNKNLEKEIVTATDMVNLLGYGLEMV